MTRRKLILLERTTVYRIAVGCFLAVGVAALVGDLWYAYHIAPKDRFADLQVYRGATAQLWRGESVYGFRRMNGDIFTYPPFGAMALSWLGALPARVAEVSLWALTAASTFMISGIVGRNTDVFRFKDSSLPDAQPPRPVLSALIFALLSTSMPIRSNLVFGQISLILVALILVDFLIIPPRWRGILTGIAAAIKITPLIFFPLFWIMRMRGGSTRALLTFLMCGLTGAAFFPRDSRLYWSGGLFDTSKIVHFSIAGNQSLMAAATRSHLPLLQDRGVWLLVSLIVATVSYGAAALSSGFGGELTAILCVGAASIIISPVSWTHHQVWLILAAVATLRLPAIVQGCWFVLCTVVMCIGIPIVAWVGAGTDWGLVNQRLVLASLMLSMTAWSGFRQRRMSGHKHDQHNLQVAGGSVNQIEKGVSLLE